MEDFYSDEPVPLQPALERLVTYDHFEEACRMSGGEGFGWTDLNIAGCTVQEPEVIKSLSKTGDAVPTEFLTLTDDCANFLIGGCASSLWSIAEKQTLVYDAYDCLQDPSDAPAEVHSMEFPYSLGRTTVILRNIPNNCEQNDLIHLLDCQGFAGSYDFLYLPIDFRTHAAIGYAFINLVSPAEAERVRWHFEGFCQWSTGSSKVCSVAWSQHQGLAEHIKRYRNSPLMHPSTPESYRPVLFEKGFQVAFPSPTKRVKPPRQGRQRMLL